MMAGLLCLSCARHDVLLEPKSAGVKVVRSMEMA